MKCRACKIPTIRFLSLGDMPLANTFLTKSQIPKEKKYDLSLSICPACHLVQLNKTVPPEELFRSYIYFSSTSTIFLEHCKETADYLTKRLKLTKKSLVLEVASNDGAQLIYFKKLGIQVLGIDPARNIAKSANKKGIPTIPEFFNLKFAKHLKNKKGIQADVVFGANVLAHVPNIVNFVKGIKVVLKPQGTAVFEFPYLKGLFENKFDTIYHEHVFYYSLLSVQNLFRQAGLTIYDADITDMQGGSLRIFAAYPGVYPSTKRVRSMLDQERVLGYDKTTTYKKIRNQVEKLRATILRALTSIKKNNKTIAAYSAPAKGNILLNYFGIHDNFIDFIVDKSSAKQGYFTPGTHLLVYPPTKIYETKPDYVLILCWNIADEVMHDYARYHKNGGKFIIPIPKLRII